MFREDYEFGFGQVGVEVAVEMRTHVSRVDLDRLWEAPCVCRHQLTSTQVARCWDYGPGSCHSAVVSLFGFFPFSITMATFTFQISYA